MKLLKFASIIVFQALTACGESIEGNADNTQTPKLTTPATSPHIEQPQEEQNNLSSTPQDVLGRSRPSKQLFITYPNNAANKANSSSALPPIERILRQTYSTSPPPVQAPLAIQDNLSSTPQDVLGRSRPSKQLFITYPNNAANEANSSSALPPIERILRQTYSTSPPPVQAPLAIQDNLSSTPQDVLGRSRPSKQLFITYPNNAANKANSSSALPPIERILRQTYSTSPPPVQAPLAIQDNLSSTPQDVLGRSRPSKQLFITYPNNAANEANSSSALPPIERILRQTYSTSPPPVQAPLAIQDNLSSTPQDVLGRSRPSKQLLITSPNNAAEEIRPKLDTHVDAEQQASAEDSLDKQITLPTQDTPLVWENAPNGVENIQGNRISLLDSPPITPKDRAHKYVLGTDSPFLVSDITPPKTPPGDKSEDKFITEAEIECVKEFSRELKSGKLLTNRRISLLEKHISDYENKIGENTYTFLKELIDSLKDCEPDYYWNGPTVSNYWGAVYSRPQKIKEILSSEERPKLDLNIYTALREDYLIDNPENLNSNPDKAETTWAAKFSAKLNDSQIQLTNESIKSFTEILSKDKDEKKFISENTFNFLISLLDELQDAELPINFDDFEINDDEYLGNLKKYHDSVNFRTYRLSKALNIHKTGPSSLDKEVYRALCLGKEYLTADEIRNLGDAAADVLADSYTDIRDEELSQSYDDISEDANHIDDQFPN